MAKPNTPQELTRRKLRWSWIISVAIVVIGLGGVGAVLGPYSGKLSEVQTNDNASFLPEGAQATKVQALQGKFIDSKNIPAIVVYKFSGPASDSDIKRLDADAKKFAEIPDIISPLPPRKFNDDGSVVEQLVLIQGDDAQQATDAVNTMREKISTNAGTTVYVTGPAGLIADFGKAFAGINGILLIVTLSAVLLILLVVYRSLLLPFIVLVTAVLALALASGLVYFLAKKNVIELNGQSQGILDILVLGACTDYALLLVSRYREELHRHHNRFKAMILALKTSIEPILASAGTVIAALLCLLFSDLKSNQTLGPVAAIGIASALIMALTFLPAVLVLVGRAGFWPVRPKYEPDIPVKFPLWGRVARFVDAKHRILWIITAVVLLGCAALVPQFKADGTSQSDSFLTRVDSVDGQKILEENFPGGTGSPAIIITKQDKYQEVQRIANDIDGVADVVPTPEGSAIPGPSSSSAPKVVDGLVQLEATLDYGPYSPEAIKIVDNLRKAVATVDGADAIVGGEAGVQLDVKNSSARDLRVIIPIVLAVILLILILLLRSFIAPLMLVATVVLSFLATLGISGLIFNHVFDFPGSDAAVPLFAFIFLVALGIDYNIFLMTRVREESLSTNPHNGMLVGLKVTGGVITSAGVVLAATFAGLAVIPVLFLAQIAFLVAFGVLLDTIIVRSLLVPALGLDIGRLIWWPSRLARVKETTVYDSETGVESQAGAESPTGVESDSSSEVDTNAETKG